MTGAIAAVATAIAAIAGLLLYLFKTRWSERARWEKELRRLTDAAKQAGNDYQAAVACGARNHDQLLAHWRLCATELANHRAAGQRAGFLDRAE